jgi:hypothetical protein
MRHPALSELGDEILILECQHSFRRLSSLDGSVPDWVREIRLAMPNRHHLPVDLRPFGLANENAVFVA